MKKKLEKAGKAVKTASDTISAAAKSAVDSGKTRSRKKPLPATPKTGATTEDVPAEKKTYPFQPDFVNFIPTCLAHFPAFLNNEPEDFNFSVDSISTRLMAIIRTFYTAGQVIDPEHHAVIKDAFENKLSEEERAKFMRILLHPNFKSAFQHEHAINLDELTAENSLILILDPNYKPEAPESTTPSISVPATPPSDLPTASLPPSYLPPTPESTIHSIPVPATLPPDLTTASLPPSYLPPTPESTTYSIPVPATPPPAIPTTSLPPSYLPPTPESTTYSIPVPATPPPAIPTTSLPPSYLPPTPESTTHSISVPATLPPDLTTASLPPSYLPPTPESTIHSIPVPATLPPDLTTASLPPSYLPPTPESTTYSIPVPATPPPTIPTTSLPPSYLPPTPESTTHSIPVPATPPPAIPTTSLPPSYLPPTPESTTYSIPVPATLPPDLSTASFPPSDLPPPPETKEEDILASSSSSASSDLPPPPTEAFIYSDIGFTEAKLSDANPSISPKAIPYEKVPLPTFTPIVKTQKVVDHQPTMALTETYTEVSEPFEPVVPTTPEPPKDESEEKPTAIAVSNNDAIAAMAHLIRQDSTPPFKRVQVQRVSVDEYTDLGNGSSDTEDDVYVPMQPMHIASEKKDRETILASLMQPLSDYRQERIGKDDGCFSFFSFKKQEKLDAVSTLKEAIRYSDHFIDKKTRAALMDGNLFKSIKKMLSHNRKHLQDEVGSKDPFNSVAHFIDFLNQRDPINTFIHQLKTYTEARAMKEDAYHCCIFMQFTKRDKIEAADQLIKILSGECVKLSKEHLAALKQGSLGELVSEFLEANHLGLSKALTDAGRLENVAGSLDSIDNLASTMNNLNRFIIQ